MGYPDVEAYSQKYILRGMEGSPFRLEHLETFLPRETIYIFGLSDDKTGKAEDLPIRRCEPQMIRDSRMPPAL
jgi:hypothetical protein